MSDSGMQRSTMRFDAATGDWIVFAPSRLRPPQAFRARELEAAQQRDSTNACPFCPGAERLTPPEVYRESAAGRGGSAWSVRVVPNRFPVLQVEESPGRSVDGDGFELMGGCGAHEVIIESPEHNVPLALQPVEQIERVLRAARSRYRDLMGDRRLQAVVIFKNHGLNAGTALAHPHWQIIATAVVPPLLRLKHARATEYFDRTGQCLYCVLAEREREAAVRMITANDEFVVVLPFASHVPFEIWVLPRRHQSSFANAGDVQLRGLADILKTTLNQLYVGLENPDFNLTIDSVARGDEEKTYFLWHIRILPRLMPTTGFELGCGMSINTVLPEEAAEYLRGFATSRVGA